MCEIPATTHFVLLDECFGAKGQSGGGIRRQDGPQLLPATFPESVARAYDVPIPLLVEQHKHTHVIVEVSQLMRLFNRPCPKCYSRQLVPGVNHVTTHGGILHNVWLCNTCHHEDIWTSSVLLRGSNVYSISSAISAAVATSGCQFGKFRSFCTALNCVSITRVTHDSNMKCFVAPAIRLMYTHTEEAIISGLSGPRTLLGDAQADSPGHCAKNQTYSIIDNSTGYLLSFAVLDKRESDLVSTRMELYGFVRCVYHLITSGLLVTKVCTDQHVMVSKLFRLIAEEAGLIDVTVKRKAADTVEKCIQQSLVGRGIHVSNDTIDAFRKVEHRLDVWYVLNYFTDFCIRNGNCSYDVQDYYILCCRHISKHILERIVKAGQQRSCRDLLPWAGPIRNHFFSSAEACQGSSRVMKVRCDYSKQLFILYEVSLL